MTFIEELAEMRNQGRIHREEREAQRLMEAQLVIDPAIPKIIEDFMSAAKSYAFANPTARVYEYSLQEAIRDLPLWGHFAAQTYFAAKLTEILEPIEARVTSGGGTSNLWKITISY